MIFMDLKGCCIGGKKLRLGKNSYSKTEVCPVVRAGEGNTERRRFVFSLSPSVCLLPPKRRRAGVDVDGEGRR